MSPDHWPKTDKEIAEFLGCSSGRIRNLRSEHLRELKTGEYFTVEYHPSNMREKYLWSLAGAVFLAHRVSKDKAKRFLASTGEALLARSRIESQIVEVVKASLTGFPVTVRTEHPVGPYKIDIYIPELGLAIECDERNHSGYCPIEEECREDYIKEKLGCTILRHDPDDPKTNVGMIINHIFKLISAKGLFLP